MTEQARTRPSPGGTEADTVLTPVDFAVPAGACDCHVHVIGDPARYPMLAQRPYTPPPAGLDRLIAMRDALGIRRLVIVQPSFYGTDNACTLDVLRRIGADARAVAVIDPDLPQAVLADLHAAGVRGVRLNFETSGGSEPHAARAAVMRLAERIAPLGWHLQLYTRMAVIAALADLFATLPVLVVIDHFGGARAAAGPDQPGFATLLDLVTAGRAYVKLSAAYRISDRAPDFVDVAPLARALVAANPERMLWGTDWPHTNPVRFPPDRITPPAAIDDGLALNQLARWVPDATIRRKILVDNPARLYGFPA